MSKSLTAGFEPAPDHQAPLVPFEWIRDLAEPIATDASMCQLLTLFGEIVLMEAEREHNERVAAIVDLARRKLEILY